MGHTLDKATEDKLLEVTSDNLSKMSIFLTNSTSFFERKPELQTVIDSYLYNASKERKNCFADLTKILFATDKSQLESVTSNCQVRDDFDAEKIQKSCKDNYIFTRFHH